MLQPRHPLPHLRADLLQPAQPELGSLQPAHPQLLLGQFHCLHGNMIVSVHRDCVFCVQVSSRKPLSCPRASVTTLTKAKLLSIMIRLETIIDNRPLVIISTLYWQVSTVSHPSIRASEASMRISETVNL